MTTYLTRNILNRHNSPNRIVFIYKGFVMFNISILYMCVCMCTYILHIYMDFLKTRVFQLNLSSTLSREPQRVVLTLFIQVI